jgi:RimJ/RimL family protein N-acetyltransferase
MIFKLVDLSDNLQRFRVYRFYHDNYEAPQYLLPQKPDDLVGNYYIVEEDGQILAVTKHIHETSFRVKTSSTVVRKDKRGQGIATFMNDEMEKMLTFSGFTKIECNIYVDNLPSLILKIKRGYLIEGLLRDHDEPGKHEYVLAKYL